MSELSTTTFIQAADPGPTKDSFIEAAMERGIPVLSHSNP